MSDSQLYPAPEPPPTPKLTLRLNTMTAVRKSLARCIRMYGRGELEDRQYRGLVYGLSQLVGAIKIEKDLVDFKERLEALETSRGIC